MAEMFLQTFTQIVSMALVGHLGASAVASIGLSMQPLNMFYGIFTGISVGATAVVSRLVGAGDHRRAAKASAQSVTISTLIAILGAIIVFVWARPVVVWMGAEPDVVGPGTQYLRVMIPGLVCMWVSTVLNGALRGAGDVRTPMRVNIIINLLSFAGNLLLVYGLLGFPALGVYGAGLATTIARVAGGVLLFVPYVLGRSSLQVGLQDFRLDRSLIARISRIGIPGVLERLAIGSGQLFYIRMVAALGTIPYAAHVIGINAESISYMPGTGFATAATTLVGQNLGADQPGNAERSAYESCRAACLFTGAMGVILLVFPEFLMRIYTGDPEIIRLGAIYLRITAVVQVPTAMGFVFPGALRGAGDTRFVLFMTAFAVWAVRLGVSHLTVNVMHIGVTGAWYAMAVDWIFRGISSWLWFRAGHWKKTVV